MDGIEEVFATTDLDGSAPDQATAPDGGWGWFIVLAAHINIVFFDGIIASIGVLLVRMKVYFGEGAGKISLIASIGLFVIHSAAPFAVVLSKRYGARMIAWMGSILCTAGLFMSGFATDFTTLCITLAVVTSTGLSFSFAPTTAMLGQYFHNRIGLANGLASAGYGIGVMGLPPLTQQLIDIYGWQGACIVLSGLVANLSVAANLLRPLEKTKDTKDKAKVKKNCILHIGDRVCWFFGFHILRLKPLVNGALLGIVLLAASNGTFVTFLLQRVADIGIDATKGSFLMTVIGASSLVIRLTHGWFVDLRIVTPIFINACSLTVWGLFNILFPLVTDYSMIVFFCVMFGLTSGLQNSLTFVIVKDIVGTELYPSAVGLLLLTFGTGSFIGILTAGSLYDFYDTADVTFYVIGIFALTGSLVLIITECIYRRQQTVDSKSVKDDETVTPVML